MLSHDDYGLLVTMGGLHLLGICHQSYALERPAGVAHQFLLPLHRHDDAWNYNHCDLILCSGVVNMLPSPSSFS